MPQRFRASFTVTTKGRGRTPAEPPHRLGAAGRELALLPPLEQAK